MRCLPGCLPLWRYRRTQPYCPIDPGHQIRPKIYCLLAPSFVGQFGLKVQPGQIVAACKKLGFKEVREVAVGADMTTISEAEEYVEKVEHGTQKLMTSSCCPAFVATVKRHAPALADCISDTVSPMVARSKAVKHDDPGALTVL